MTTIIDQLLVSAEPSVRYKLRVDVLGENPASESIRVLQAEVKNSPRVRAMIDGCKSEDRVLYKAYSKWFGSHWVLALLADMGYPPGEEELAPLRESVLGTWLSDQHTAAIRTIDGRVRRCASQEGNALFAILTLGLDDARCAELAARLEQWQWPDGGWNCDKNPSASHSSFMESLIPLRGLALYARRSGDPAAHAAVQRAADFFLRHRLFRREQDGAVIKPEFTCLHYPCYWHYDILFGLKVMAEAGFIHDPRCREALDLLESKRRPGGGFPAEGRYYPSSHEISSHHEGLSWGATLRNTGNEFVTADALAVLHAAGRQAT
jgi:hypothetical protein